MCYVLESMIYLSMYVRVWSLSCRLDRKCLSCCEKTCRGRFLERLDSCLEVYVVVLGVS